MRFEDVYFGNKPYSFGITLKEISAQTCDDQWKYKFYDRTADENKDEPIFKLLVIDKFAFYWQSNEESLASQEWSTDNEMQSFMEYLFPIDATHIENYSYIIEPSNMNYHF